MGKLEAILGGVSFLWFSVSILACSFVLIPHGINPKPASDVLFKKTDNRHTTNSNKDFTYLNGKCPKSYKGQCTHCTPNLATTVPSLYIDCKNKIVERIFKINYLGFVSIKSAVDNSLNFNFSKALISILGTVVFIPYLFALFFIYRLKSLKEKQNDT